jgi:hypothetical protein
MGIMLQTPPPARTAPQPGTSGALTSVLPSLYWSVAARGPLLIVGAERYKLTNEPKPLSFFGGAGMFGGMMDMATLMGQKPQEPLKLDAAPREGWNPTVIAPRFGSQIVRVGTVSVFAPLLLPDTSTKKDPLGGADIAELIQEGMAMGMGGSRLLPLLASLTPNQLNQATSAAGLPIASLDRTQKALFQPLLRRSLPFRFMQKPNLPVTGPFEQAPLIPQADQSQFRLRLTRSLSITPTVADAGASGPGIRMAMRLGNLVSEPTEGEVRTLALKPGKQPNPMAMMTMLGMGGTEKGVPARKKSSEINTDAGFLNAPVSLANIKTVEELVARVAQVTKLALVADQRIGKLSVSARGTSARAGDVIQALCWAVGGAVRRVSDDRESVYLLTEQVEIKEGSNPIAAIMPAVSGMMQDQKVAERKATDARIRLIRQGVLSSVPRGVGARMGEGLWRVAEARPTPEGNKVSVGELPADLQKQAIQRHEEFSKAFASIPDGTPGLTKPSGNPLTHVRCGQDLVAELVAPTLGAVATLTSLDAAEIHPEIPVPAPPPAVTLPEQIKTRALLVALPASVAQSEALVASAQSRGFTELRVSTAVSQEKELAQLAAAARGKLGVIAVLGPLEPLTETAPRERSWAGQSFPEWLATPSSQKFVSDLPPQLRPLMGRLFGQDYTTPEGADVAGFVARVKRLLALPGVTGFAMERLAAPGYRDGVGAMSDGAMFFWQGGANARERVAFLKEQKSDAAEQGGFNLTEMFSGGGSRTAWLKRTTARSDAFLARLSAGLTKENLVPNSVLSASEPPRWEKWTGKFTQGAAVTMNLRPVLKTISYSRILAQPGSLGDASEFAGFDEPDQFAGLLGKELTQLTSTDSETRWDGLVIDLADQSPEVSLVLLERALLKK